KTLGKKVPKKVLCYFPIIPRLQRLYKSSHTANEMIWHATEKCTEPGKMQHPVDGKAWKNFDAKYSDFAKEPRNVRLRRFLKKPHKWRSSRELNGQTDNRDPPKEFGRDEILAQLDRLPMRLTGKHSSYGGVKIKRNVLVELNWTKQSIYNELEYWSFLTLRHNLDIMHIEKNVLEAILNTLLMNEKPKDTAKARQNLQRLGIQSGLWLGQTKNGKCLKPQTAYSFTTENQKKFCQFIKGVKLPDGFRSCFKHKVTDNDTNIMGLKSHDCHIMMQQALEGGPIRPRWMFPFERYMKKIKCYVRNKAKPEGSIAEGYVAEEALTLSYHYFRDVTMKFNRFDRNVDPPPPTCQFQVFRSVCKSIGLRSVIRFDAQELKKVKRLYPNKDMKEEFPDWFGSQIRQHHVDNDKYPKVSTTNKLFALACGPKWTPISVNSCVVDGVRYFVHSRDERRTTQNSGIYSPGPDGEMYYDGQSMKVDAPPDIIDVVDEDDDIIDDEDALPHDLADSDDEDLINVDDDGVDKMSADVAQSYSGDGGGEDRPPPHHVPTGCEGCFANRGPEGAESGAHYRYWGQLSFYVYFIITQFDLRPHMESSDWTVIDAGIQQHLQKAYNTTRLLLRPTIGNIARAAQNRQNRAKSTVISRQGSWSLARLRDEMRLSSATQEYRSLVDTFFVAYTVNGVFTRDEDRLIYDEMRRMEATSTYTDDEINLLARMGKQRGHIPGVDRFESAGASGSGGSGNDEESADDQEDEDENGDDDSYDMSPMKMCHGGTNYLSENYVGPTVSLGNVSLASVPRRTFSSDKSLGKDHPLILMPEFSPRVTPETRLTRVIPLCVGATPHQWPKISSDTGRSREQEIASTNWCLPMFQQTLDGPARGWFDRLPNRCIDNWMDLREAFVERFALRRKCCKDPTKVAKIISAFVSNSKCPELARRFSDQVSQTVTEMMRRVDDFVKLEEVFKNTELPKGEHPERPAVTQFRGSRPPRHSYGSRPSRADIYRRGDHYQPYVTPRAPDRRYDNRRREFNHLRLDSLTMLTSEILATELQLRLPPCPPTVAPPQKKNMDRKLNHLIKDMRQRGGDRGRQTGNNNGQRKVINKVQQSNNGLKRKSLYKKFEEWIDVPITFPSVSTDDVSDEPLIVEAKVEVYWIRRVFVDQGAAVQVMFEHCFDNLSSDIKARLAPTQTELVGFSGEQLIPIGKIELKHDEVSNTKRNRYHMRPGKADILMPMVGKKGGGTRGNGKRNGRDKEPEHGRRRKNNMDVFAWQPSDIEGVPRRLVRNALNVNHSVPLVTQKQRVLGTEKSKMVTREVEEWVKAGIVRPVKYPTWISNPILVKKADDTWKMCIDFKNLNSACPKDYFPLPEIDLKIEAPSRTYCYVKMPFGLKNVGATYQRLIDSAFQTHLGEGKFLGYMVTSEGIRANPKKTKAIADMQSPKILKEMQSLSGKLAALNRFLSRSAERSLPFFETLKNITKENKKDYRWTEEAEHAFQELKKFILELPTLTTLKLKETLFVYLATSHDVVSNVITYQPIKKILNKPEVSGKLAKYVVELGAYNITYIPQTAVKGKILADFIKEIPTRTQHIEACNLAGEKDSKGWTLYTDGASSQKGVRAGLVLIDPSGTEYTYAIRLPSTNNEAEYEALLVGLRIARKMKVQTLDVKEVSTIAEEEEDNWMTPIIKCLEEGVWPTDENKSRTLRMKIGQEVHEGACGLHAGARSVVAKIIRQGYYWPTMHRDTKEVVDKYNRTQLVNDPFKSRCEKWKIKHMNTSVVHPQANGLVERANKSLMHGLKARLEKEIVGCVDELPNILWAH
nr:hypothetical protein [Tanacetum cinerariifolium]